MRIHNMVGLGLLVAGGMIWPGERAAAGPDQKSNAVAAEKPAWSATLNGLRVRLSTPGGTHFQYKSLLPLVVEVQNDGKTPIPYAELWRTVRVLAHDDKGNWIGIPAMGPHVGQWAARAGNLAPGEITEERFPLQSLRFNRPLKAGEKISLQVSAPTQQRRAEHLPLEVQSPAVQIQFDADFPHVLAEAEIGQDWNLDLAYENNMPLLGIRTLQVDAHGVAMLVDTLQQDGRRVDRRMSMTLPADRLRQLSAALRKVEIWKLSQIKSEPGVPDEGMIRVALSSPAGGSVVGEFAWHLESDHAIVREFRELMDGVVSDVEALDAAKSGK